MTPYLPVGEYVENAVSKKRQTEACREKRG